MIKQLTQFLALFVLTGCAAIRHHPGDIAVVAAHPVVFVVPVAGWQVGRGAVVLDSDTGHQYLVTCDHVVGFSGVAVTSEGIMYRDGFPRTLGGWGFPLARRGDIYLDVAVQRIDRRRKYASPLSRWNQGMEFEYLGRRGRSISGGDSGVGILRGWALPGDSGSAVRNDSGAVVGIIAAIGLLDDRVVCVTSQSIKRAINNRYPYNMDIQ